VVLSSEKLDGLAEPAEDALDVLEVVLLEGSELLDGSEELDELGNSSAEEVELSEDLVGGELELLAFGHVHKAFFGELVLLLVRLVEVDAGLEHWDQVLGRILLVAPKDIVVLHFVLEGSEDLDVSFLDLFVVQDVELAVGDHLVGDLDEEASHSVVGVVVTSDGVDHLDAVHQSGEGVLDGIWGAFVKGLDELLESGKVLHIVFGFVEGLGHSQLDASPSRGSDVDLVSRLSELFGRVLGSSSEDIVHGPAVLAPKLL
jgi:hypothetical protein